MAHDSRSIGSISTTPAVSALPRGLSREELETLLKQTAHDLARLKESRETFEAAQRAAGHEPPKGPTANETMLAIRETQLRDALTKLGPEITPLSRDEELDIADPIWAPEPWEA